MAATEWIPLLDPQQNASIERLKAKVKAHVDSKPDCELTEAMLESLATEP